MNRNQPRFQQLICQKHRQPIKYVCEATFKPLCLKCAQEHVAIHHSQTIHIDQAMNNAYINMTKHKKAIDGILAPYSKKTQFYQKLKKQQDDLKRQRQRMVRQIDKLIESQLRELRNRNNVGLRDNPQLVDSLLKKQKQIQNLLAYCTRDAKSLQQALTFQLQDFIQRVDLNNQIHSHFYFYPDTQHRMQIGQLQLVAETINKKPLKTVMNQSPLYFLVDKNIKDSTPVVALFNNQQKYMKTYNVETQKWGHFHSDFPIYPDGCQIKDPFTNRFFWIGGTKDNRNKSNQIIIIDTTQKSSREKIANMKTGRSSCMATTVFSANKEEIGILISGGIGSNGEILKSCEYLSLKEQTYQTISFGNTNFGCFGGTLVTYNGDTVLRFGGLAKKNNYDYSIVEIVQKLSLRSFFQQKQRRQIPRWSYIQFQIPKSDRNSVPRLFYANQGAIQINPQQIFVFGGNSKDWKGVTQSYLISVEEYVVQGRFGNNPPVNQQKFIVRWVNQKPLITGDHFAGLQPIVWGGKVYSLQNTTDSSKKDNKRLIQFDMYNWWETPNVLQQ